MIKLPVNGNVDFQRNLIITFDSEPCVYFEIRDNVSITEMFIAPLPTKAFWTRLKQAWGIGRAYFNWR